MKKEPKTDKPKEVWLVIPALKVVQLLIKKKKPSPPPLVLLVKASRILAPLSSVLLFTVWTIPSPNIQAINFYIDGYCLEFILLYYYNMQIKCPLFNLVFFSLKSI